VLAPAAPSTAARVGLGVLGAALVVAAWEYAGTHGALDGAIPSVSDVVDTLTDPLRRPLFDHAISASVREAAWGLLFGCTFAVLLAAIPHVLPFMRRTTQRIAATLLVLPIIVVGPVLVSVLTNARHDVPILVATISAFGAMFAPAAAGFEATDPAHLDVFRAFGARPTRRWWSLQVPASLPMLASGLRLAAPAAMLGAIFGEWFGAEQGLGPVLVNSMRNAQVPLLWAVAVVASVLSAIAYAVAAAFQRMVEARLR
jgi:NitT/TauT family transport system permease protein